MLKKLTNWLVNSPNILALDIGSRYMKVMQLEQNEGLPSLHGAAIGPVPAGSVENGIIVDKPAVASALRRMLDKHAIKGSRVYLAAGGPSLLLRWIEMPAMAEGDLHEAIESKAHKHIPLPAEQYVLNYTTLTRRGRQSEEIIRVLLIAVPCALVDSRYETAELAGLKPIGIDVEPFAVLRALEHDHFQSDLAWNELPQAVLMFGSSGTDFYIIKDSDLEFARRITIGGSHLARIIADGLNIDPAESDEYDLIHRISFDMEGELMVKDVPEETTPKVKAEIARLDREIYESYGNFQSLFPKGSYEGVLTHVAISGGLAGIAGFRAHLARILNLNVDIADPLAKINIRNLSGSSELLNGRRTSFIVSAGLFLSQTAA